MINIASYWPWTGYITGYETFTVVSGASNVQLSGLSNLNINANYRSAPYTVTVTASNPYGYWPASFTVTEQPFVWKTFSNINSLVGPTNSYNLSNNWPSTGYIAGGYMNFSVSSPNANVSLLGGSNVVLSANYRGTTPYTVTVTASNAFAAYSNTLTAAETVLPAPVWSSSTYAYSNTGGTNAIDLSQLCVIPPYSTMVYAISSSNAPPTGVASLSGTSNLALATSNYPPCQFTVSASNSTGFATSTVNFFGTTMTPSLNGAVGMLFDSTYGNAFAAASTNTSNILLAGVSTSNYVAPYNGYVWFSSMSNALTMNVGNSGSYISVASATSALITTSPNSNSLWDVYLNSSSVYLRNSSYGNGTYFLSSTSASNCGLVPISTVTSSAAFRSPPATLSAIPGQYNLAASTDGVGLAPYFASVPPLTYAVTSNPYGDAYVSGAALYINPYWRGASYNVGVSATNSFGSIGAIVPVSEQSCPPPAVPYFSGIWSVQTTNQGTVQYGTNPSTGQPQYATQYFISIFIVSYNWTYLAGLYNVGGWYNCQPYITQQSSSGQTFVVVNGTALSQVVVSFSTSAENVNAAGVGVWGGQSYSYQLPSA